MPTITIDEVIECDDCGERVSDTRSADDSLVCLSCADEYSTCDRCDHLTSTTSRTVDGENVCRSCARLHYRRCDECSRLTDRYDAWATASGSTLCPSCADGYWSCEGCGELIDEGDYCSSCEPEHEDLSCAGLINDYGYKPPPRFHGTGPLYLGLELEINAPTGELRDCAESAVRHLGTLGYLKEDCSINDDTGYGFEVVTHPMSYDWAVDRFPWEMLTDLARRACGADGNGLHVHVSRAAFESAIHVYRWMKFLYRNSRQVTAVARRESGQWAAFHDRDRQQVKDYSKGARGARYRAINTNNAETFELRVFASSLRPQEVQAALGLAAASVEYTRFLTVADIAQRDGWSWPAFVAWLDEHHEYAPLSDELEALACAC